MESPSIQPLPPSPMVLGTRNERQGGGGGAFDQALADQGGERQPERDGASRRELQRRPDADRKHEGDGGHRIDVVV
ncbi:MAG: hypothetical protein AAF628_02620 [Planctomycetota bacterium]